jgi:serine phosphatase RsbU (regulator of sigma subunit)
MLLMLTDDRLVEAMRAFVTATNRVQHLSQQPRLDMHLLDQASEAQGEAARLLNEALVQRGWRRPGG